MHLHTFQFLRIFSAFVIAALSTSPVLAAEGLQSDGHIIPKENGEYCYLLETTRHFSLLNAEGCSQNVLNKPAATGLVSLPGRPFSLPLKKPYEMKPGALYPTLDVYMHVGKETFGLFMDSACSMYAGCGNYLPKELILKSKGTRVENAIDIVNGMYFEHLVDDVQKRHVFTVLYQNQSFNIQLFPDNPTPTVIAAAWQAVTSLTPHATTDIEMEKEADQLNLDRWNNDAGIPADWKLFTQDVLPFQIKLPEIQELEGDRLNSAARREWNENLFSKDELKKVVLDSVYEVISTPTKGKELSLRELDKEGTRMRFITLFVKSGDPESFLKEFCYPFLYDQKLDNGFHISKRVCHTTVNPGTILTNYVVIHNQTVTLVDIMTSDPTALMDSVIKQIQVNDDYHAFNGWKRFLFSITSATGRVMDFFEIYWDALIMWVHGLLFSE